MATLRDNLNYLTGVKSNNPEATAIALDDHIIRRADESSSPVLTEVRMINVHLDSLRKATESLQTSHASLQSGMASLQANNASLKANMENLQTNYVSLQASMASLQTNYVSLQGSKLKPWHIWTGVTIPLVFGLCAISVAIYFGLLASSVA